MLNTKLIEANPWALVSIGLFSGLLGSMLGVGGGFFIVPMLTLGLRLPIHIAIASSLVAIVVTSCTAASIYARTGFTNVKVGLLLETTTTPGAIVGALIASLIASSILSASFGILLIYVAYSMVSRRPFVAKEISAENNSPGQLEHYYHKPNSSEVITYKVKHIPLGLGASFFAGILSSLFGIGGGIIKVPIMYSLMGLPTKSTIGTSSFMVAITTTVGAIIYYYQGKIYPMIVAPLVMGAFAGARLGAEITQRTRGAWLRRIFAVATLATAILMFLQAAHVIGA